MGPSSQPNRSSTEDPECCCSCCDQNEFSRPVSTLVAQLQTDRIQDPLSHIPLRARNCSAIPTGTCFPTYSNSFSPLLFPVQTKRHLWTGGEHKQKALRRKSFRNAPPTLGTGCQINSTMQKTYVFSARAHDVLIQNNFIAKCQNNCIRNASWC